MEDNRIIFQDASSRIEFEEYDSMWFHNNGQIMFDNPFSGGGFLTASEDVFEGAAYTIGLNDEPFERIHRASQAVEIIGHTIEIRGASDFESRLMVFTDEGNVRLPGDDAAMGTQQGSQALPAQANVPEFLIQDRNGNVVAKIRALSPDSDSAHLLLKGAIRDFSDRGFAIVR